MKKRVYKDEFGGFPRVRSKVSPELSVKTTTVSQKGGTVNKNSINFTTDSSSDPYNTFTFFSFRDSSYVSFF